MLRVCRRWREVVIELVLWRNVDLFILCVIKVFFGIIEKLVFSRLIVVIELSFLGWEKFIDKGI